jgi:methylated-DNA-[protein]-cysteine S-methyltransferase
VWHELPRPRQLKRHEAHPLAERLAEFFAGAGVCFDDVELGVEWATPFQRALAETLRAVPRGEVVTYGELAALAGRPGAARAAGTFCARNPLPIFLPCHRVVASGGIGGYGSSGIEYKRRLLALESDDAL